jgi:hypothetical protein
MKEEFKRVTSLAFCNLIGPPRSGCVDPKQYRQSPRPSLRVFILKELNTAVGVVWYRDYSSSILCYLRKCLRPSYFVACTIKRLIYGPGAMHRYITDSSVLLVYLTVCQLSFFLFE